MKMIADFHKCKRKFMLIENYYVVMQWPVSEGETPSDLFAKTKVLLEKISNILRKCTNTDEITTGVRDSDNQHRIFLIFLLSTAQNGHKR